MPDASSPSPSGSPSPSPRPSAPGVRSGFIQAIGAYGLWGFLPVYFLVLAPSGPFEIVAFRILFSLVFCALLLTVTRSWGAVVAIVRSPRLLLTVGLAGVFIYVNWQVYIFAVLTDRVLEGALGYFINPIVTVLLGVLILRERLRPAQWVAVAISFVAVLVLAIGYGTFPWISLALAFSFGLYGLIKKRVGPRVDAVSGLSLETAWLTPVAVIQLAVVGSSTGILFGSVSVGHTLLVIGSGVITAVPLLLFAGAARRLPLITLGLVQYLAPLLQFAFGAFVLREAMPPERWVGFGLVWVALIVLTVDMVVSGRSARRVVRPLT
ncbi:EamA family transporter RarD [Marisediminicola sp. LYQ134]|uniref:EamA family transporter RarD n=1 Tax=Marisediminicola sp. LYQ134 TaxID=3391061 RepID=UPI0039833DF8